MSLEIVQIIEDDRTQARLIDQALRRALRRLAINRGKVVPREELHTLLWGDDELVHERDLNGCMESLKQKLDGAPSDGTIVSLSSGGYQLTLPPTDQEAVTLSTPPASPP